MRKGSHMADEQRTRVSNGHKNPSPETRAKMSAIRWAGGKKQAIKKRHAKRRTLGFVPLNEPFDGCEGHHVDKKHVIYIPKELHNSVFHNVWTGKNMEKINALAYAYLETCNALV